MNNNPYLEFKLPIMSTNFPIIDNNLFLRHKKNTPLRYIYKINKNLQSAQKYEFNFEYEKNRLTRMFDVSLDYELPNYYIDYIMMKQLQSL